MSKSATDRCSVTLLDAGASRSKNGADAWATLASLLRTGSQQGKNLPETVKAMLQSKWASGMPPAMPAAP